MEVTVKDIREAIKNLNDDDIVKVYLDLHCRTTATSILQSCEVRNCYGRPADLGRGVLSINVGCDFTGGEFGLKKKGG